MYIWAPLSLSTAQNTKCKRKSKSKIIEVVESQKAPMYRLQTATRKTNKDGKLIFVPKLQQKTKSTVEI